MLTRAPDEQRPRSARLLVAAGLGILAAAGVTAGVRVIVDGYSPVPFADFWGQFPFLERAYGVDLRPGDFWAQANEHRIAVPRIQFLLDYRLFGGTYVFLFSAIAASCLLLAAVLAGVAWLDSRDAFLAWGVFCVAAIAALSPVAAENLTWAFQVQFVQVFLFAALAIAAVVAAARSPVQRRADGWTIASATAGIAATYSLANGLLVWPVVLVVTGILGLRARARAFLAAVAGLAVGSYLWRFDFETHGNLAHPIGIVEYVTLYLGTIVRSGGTTAAGAVGAGGLAAFALLVLVAWKERADGSRTTSVGAALALFVVLTAVQTAAGRLQLGVAQALASRYATGSFAFWLGLLLGFLGPVGGRARRPWVATSAYLGAAAAAALVLGLVGRPSRTSLHSTVVGKEDAVLAFRVGVADPAGTTTGGAPDAVVERTFRWLQRHDLGPWAPGGMVERTPPPVPPARSTRTCRGGIESAEPVGGGLRLRGWAAPPEGEDAGREVAVFAAGGRRRGMGLVGTYRPDVEASGAASSAWTGFVAYARGRSSSRLRLVLAGRDGRSAVCQLDVP
jgi:hypothetical protein